MLEKANDVLQEILAENIGESTELEKADWKEMAAKQMYCHAV